MAIKLDEALSVHAQMLDYRIERSKILASNLANAETPGYQARDINFAQVLKNLNTGDNAIQRNYEVGYRVPNQSSADLNTVELGVEQAKFSQNAMDYQTSLTFLNSKINGIRSAIEGK